MGGNRSKWCPECVLCFHALLPLHDRSIILIRNVSFPEGWGIQQQHGGILRWKRGNTPRHDHLHAHCTHSTAQKHARTHEDFPAVHLNPVHPVPFDSRAAPCFYLQARRNAVLSTFKTCCSAENELIPRPACYMNKKTKNRRPAKTFPTQLILKRSPGRSNFRFATQLLQIQSSFWLSGWLAAPPNKAPIVWNL